MRQTNRLRRSTRQRTSACRFPAGRKAARRGATAVEFALVAPLIFALFFASVEFGRVLTVLHGLNVAAHDSCRMAVSWDPDTKEFEQIVSDRLATFGISGYRLATEPASLGVARQWDPVTVRIEVDYGQVSWLPSPRFVKNLPLAGSCTLPQESDPKDF